MEFDWDVHNLYHIQEHGLSQADVETALLGLTVLLHIEARSGEERTSRLGRTLAGRTLYIVTTIRKGKTRVVTAFPAGRKFRGRFIAKEEGLT